MPAPIRTVEEARARLERLGSRDPDALDAYCGRLARGSLAVAFLGGATVVLCGLLLVWVTKPIFFLPLGVGALVAARGARGVRAIAVARRDFLRGPHAVAPQPELGSTAPDSAGAEAPGGCSATTSRIHTRRHWR